MLKESELSQPLKCTLVAGFMLLMWEENLGTQAAVHLIEGVLFMWGLINTDFTIKYKINYQKIMCMHLLYLLSMV